MMKIVFKMLYSLIVFMALWRVAVSVPCSDTVLLNDCNSMPAIAFGTLVNVKNLSCVRDAVAVAIESGFRHIDTAPMYLDETLVGEAIADVIARGVVTRDQLFITTKLDNVTSPDEVLAALNKSLNKMQLDYVDLYLIHFPFNAVTFEITDFVETWKGMEQVQKCGYAKSIGVSNFNSTHLNHLLKSCEIRPAVNQIEVNPTNAQLDLVAYCQKEGIVVTAYGPMGFTVPRLYLDISPPPSLDDELLMSMAEKYNKTTSQVALRYLMDRGIVPIPGSLNSDHISSNIQVCDFSLTKEEVYSISEFDVGITAHISNIHKDIEIVYLFGMTLAEVFLQI